jgi:hypothetical protein
MRNRFARWGVWGGGALLALALGLVLAGGVSAAGPFGGNPSPVVVTGASVPALQGVPASSLYVYIYQGGNFAQIPYQIDHVVAGTYTSGSAFNLGAADEIAFMAEDMGAQATAEQVKGALPINNTWYEIQVTDPIHTSYQGWIYLVASSTLTKTFTDTYVHYDAANHRIVGGTYSLGLATTFPGFDYLALNGGDNVLDRTKIRLETILGTQTEEALGTLPVNLLVDGPVRVILKGANSIASMDFMGFRAVVVSTLAAEIPFGVSAIRLSTDFNATANGSKFYNDLIPAGVVVDGSADTITPTPLSPWWEVSGSTGTVLQVADTSQVGGTQTNYYKDDATIDLNDTGDKKSYSDVGYRVEGPNAKSTYRTTMTMLGPNLRNMGSTIMAYLAQPLQVSATMQQGPQPYRVLLPIIIK